MQEACINSPHSNHDTHAPPFMYIVSIRAHTHTKLKVITKLWPRFVNIQVKTAKYTLKYISISVWIAQTTISIIVLLKIWQNEVRFFSHSRLKLTLFPEREWPRRAPNHFWNQCRARDFGARAWFGSYLEGGPVYDTWIFWWISRV